MKPSTMTGPCRSPTRSEATGAQTPRRTRAAFSPDSIESPPRTTSSVRHPRVARPGSVGGGPVRGVRVGRPRGVVVLMGATVDLLPLVPVQTGGSGGEQSVVLLVDVVPELLLQGVHQRVVARDDGFKKVVEAAVLAAEHLDVVMEPLAASHDAEESHLLGLGVGSEEVGQF